MKKIFWQSYHPIKEEQIQELASYFAVEPKELEIVSWKVNVGFVKQLLSDSQGCDVIFSVIPPELKSDFFTQKPTGIPMIISIGEYITTGATNLVSGKLETQYEHDHFELLTKFCYRTQPLTDKKINGINSILLTTKQAINDQQKADLNSIFGTNHIDIKSLEIADESYQDYLETCSPYDAVYPSVSPKLKAQISTTLLDNGKIVLDCKPKQRHSQDYEWFLIEEYKVEQRPIQKGEWADAK